MTAQVARQKFKAESTENKPTSMTSLVQCHYPRRQSGSASSLLRWEGFAEKAG